MPAESPLGSCGILKMSGPLRSKQGCWTCRLRKKKCDEQRARCALCESLCLPCYGYGPKPDWMKNGETEREMADSLKQIVKHTSRHKPASPAVKRRRPVVQIAPKPTDGAGGAASSSTSESNDPSLVRSLDLIAALDFLIPASMIHPLIIPCW